MTTAALLLVCLVLCGAVAALAVALRRVQARLVAIESRPVVEEVAQPPSRHHGDVDGSAGLVTGAGAPSSTNEQREYLITRLGNDRDEPAPALETRLFADLVLRESVVKAASWVYGVRRGLSPENRNRIWFEMRREVKRARKQRRAEEREAIREWRARQRSALREEDAA
jgi:hypothetical protein